MVATAAITAGVIAAGAGAYAASEQADAAESAANTQAEASDRASEVQRDLYQQTRDDLAPYRELGTGALPQLRDLTNTFNYGEPFNFQNPYGPDLAPFTGQIDLFRDPSFQFRLQEGQRAVERSAASKGHLQSGNTLRDLTRFGQGLASQEYGAAYQRALLQNQAENATRQQQYGNTVDFYNRGVDNQVRDYNRLQAEQLGQFNRLSGLVGLGSGAAGQQVGANTQFGQQVGENILGRGNALAAGQIGSANAFAGGLQGVAGAGQGALNNYLTLSALGLIGPPSYTATQPYYSGGTTPPSVYYAPPTG